MRYCFKLALSGLVLMGLTACINTGCEDYRAYRDVKASAPVKVPADLEQPDNESLAPRVTNENPDALRVRADGTCLDKPPKI